MNFWQVSSKFLTFLSNLWIERKLRRQLSGEPFDRKFSLLMDRLDGEVDERNESATMIETNETARGKAC